MARIESNCAIMNRHATFSSCLLLCALLGAAAPPSARAGGAINKCIDGAGRVTLTDQPCAANTVRSAIAVPGMADDDAAPAPVTAMASGGARPPAAPLRPARWLPGAAPHAALAGDMATLRQARIQMALQDAAPRTRLASLER